MPRPYVRRGDACVALDALREGHRARHASPLRADGAGDKEPSRRQLLRTAVAGGLLAGMSLLVLRRTQGGGDCTRAIACRSCGQFGGCELPRATDLKSQIANRKSQIPPAPESAHG